MANLVLASGPVTSDALSVELLTSMETPDVIMVRWPDVPTVMNPKRFAATALSVISIMDRALAEVQKRGEA